VEKDFVRRGIKRIALDTRLTREDAHTFYECSATNETGGDLWQLAATN
jgi:hypothetical protein